MFYIGMFVARRQSSVGARIAALSSAMVGSGSIHSRLSMRVPSIMSSEEAVANETAAFEHVHYKRSENPNAPMVMLFGWAGCHDRYLTKYSQMYEEKSCSVARYTAPIAKIRSFSSYRAFALGVYEKVLDNDDKEPLIFHVFSMNGCSLFVALWDLLDTLPNGADIKARTKGIIFDSCPANVQPWQAANAISFATLPPSKFGSVSRNSYRVLLAGFFASHRALVWLQSFFDANAFETNYAYFRMLKIMDLPKRQLYLFSNADDICSDHSIEDFQKVQQERGASVTSKCWADSLHVQHLRAHPEEYAQLCDRFIGDTLIELTPRHSA
uniref:Transmembrane protein 53 n=1 Tax=Panagrellus redivivus TaxID=6233 RepID=A0A7E4VYR9_PANRE